MRRMVTRQFAGRKLPIRRALYGIIMAGGQSTRFWPLSRRRAPKQLLAIAGKRTLLQETARRLRPLIPWHRMLVVTGAEHAHAVRRQLPLVPREQILVEPVGRNTAACVALAAEWIATRAVDGVMMVVPADHVVKDGEGLRRALRGASDLATHRDCLVTIGIPATRPETGFGYIALAGAVGEPLPEAFWVRRFHEKPSLSSARRYVASGRYLWNSGMFVWKASVFRHALERCLPRMREALDGLWASRQGIAQRLRRAYQELPSVSVDVGIMQPLSTWKGDAVPVAVVRGAFDWVDAGTWGAMAELWRCDSDGNAAPGRLVAIDATGCIVYSPKHLAVLVGVQNLIVVENEGALLVCARDRAQDVRRVAGALEERGLSRYV